MTQEIADELVDMIDTKLANKDIELSTAELDAVREILEQVITGAQDEL